MSVYEQDPDENLDYSIEVKNMPAGEAISTFTLDAPAGLTISQVSNTTSIATFWLTGGTRGVMYRVTGRIGTNQGRQYRGSFHVLMKRK